MHALRTFERNSNCEGSVIPLYRSEHVSVLSPEDKEKKCELKVGECNSGQSWGGSSAFLPFPFFPNSKTWTTSKGP